MNSSESPTVLLTATARFIFPARLAMALAEAGFPVEAACPRGHFLACTTAVKRLHRYGALGGIKSLRAAMAKAKPVIVIPCDDLALSHLHRLYVTEHARADGGEICAVIERSLGNPASYPVVESRSRLQALVREEGQPAVETTVVSSARELTEWLDVNGLPAVLKTDGSSGGYGVRVSATAGDAEAARGKLAARPGLARAIKRALVNHNTTFLSGALAGAAPAVSAQKFIDGSEATSTAACWKGAVLATLTFEVLRTMYPGGPAAVVRLLEHATIDSTVRKTVARLGLSGICGFDFMIENGTGIPHLIEMNPRATQTTHLRLGPGRDAAAALFTAITGKNAGAPATEIRGDTIALYPQERTRDPASEFLKTAYHDAPSGEPTLIRAILESQGMRF